MAQVDSDELDRLIVELVDKAGMIDQGELVVEAVLSFAMVDANRPNTHRYGYVVLGTPAQHHVTGLLSQTARCIEGREAPQR